MSRAIMKILLAAVSALVVVGSTMPASAVRPTKEITVYRDEGWFTMPDISCDGFTLTEVLDAEYVRETVYFDEAGEEIKIVLKGNFFGTITNTASDNTYRDHASFTETVDLVTGTTTVSGASYHYIVKGKGQVFAEVGHKITVADTDPVEVLFQGGQDDLADDPGLLGLCDHLI